VASSWVFYSSVIRNIVVINCKELNNTLQTIQKEGGKKEKRRSSVLRKKKINTKNENRELKIFQ